MAPPPVGEVTTRPSEESLLDKALGFLGIIDAAPRTFRYPVLEYPERVKAINLEKTPDVEGTLLGIKGQYLILDAGVLNVRKYGGYEIEFSS